jgi:hypothetical protein
MAFVATQYALPTITGSRGQVLPWAITPGRCPVDLKRGIQRAQGTIRPRVRRGGVRLAPGSPVYLNGFWSELLNTAKGAAEGFATGGPAGAVVGGAVGAIPKGGAKGNPAQEQQAAPAPSGPLAGISTSTLVVGGMAFGALVIALAKAGR